MDGSLLAALLLFGCRGERGKVNFTQSALHPLRRRANSCARTDPRHPPPFITLPTTPSAPGALLLSSYLLVHFLIPRMRNLNMDASENAVCLLRARDEPGANRDALEPLTPFTDRDLRRTSGRDSAPLKSAHQQPRRRRTLAKSQTLKPMRGLRRQLRRRASPRNAHTMEAVCTPRCYLVPLLSDRRLTRTTRTVSHPEAKRKTMMEKAGEPLKPGPSAGVGIPRPAMGVKGASIAALSAATASRHAPTNSFAKSVGPGARPPKATRPPTSMGFAQSTTTRPRGYTGTRPRPATAMANREAEVEPGQPNQKKGMNTFPSSLQHRLRYQKSRNATRQQPVAPHTRQASRDISGLSRRFETLSLDDRPNGKSNGGQVVSKQHTQPPSRSSQSDVQTESTTPTKVRQEEAARGNPLGPADSKGASAPTTPPLKRFNTALDTALGTAQTWFRTPSKGPLSPAKSCSSANRWFLTKDSNVTSFTGWDVDGRLNEFESQFKVMKETFEGTMTDRKVLEEAIDLAKNRGMYRWM